MAGDAVESIGIVVAGTVQMIKEDIMGDKSIITTMGSGSIFAENFLGHDKQDEKTNVSYFAASDSEVLMVPFGKVLTDLSNNDPCRNKLLTNMISIMASNNAQLIEKTEILCKKTLRGKIMTYLEQEAKRNGSTEFEIPFNRTDMANYLDADRSALTRELARIAVRYAFENHLFDDVVEVDNSEQKTKVLDLRPRSDREKFRQNMGRKSEENSDCLQRRQELLRIQDA